MWESDPAAYPVQEVRFGLLIYAAKTSTYSIPIEVFRQRGSVQLFRSAGLDFEKYLVAIFEKTDPESRGNNRNPLLSGLDACRLSSISSMEISLNPSQTLSRSVHLPSSIVSKSLLQTHHKSCRQNVKPIFAYLCILQF